MKDKSGFTLVEIIVAISITLIIATIGIASFTELNRRQIIDQTTKKILADIRLAQNMAISQQKPETGTCIKFNGYNFNLNTTTKIYSIDADCTPTCSGCTSYKTVTVSGIILSGFSKITFGRANVPVKTTGGSSLVVSSSVSSITRTITIGQGGDITVQ